MKWWKWLISLLFLMCIRHKYISLENSAQRFSSMKNTYWRGNEQHADCNKTYFIVHINSANILPCSHRKHRKWQQQAAAVLISLTVVRTTHSICVSSSQASTLICTCQFHCGCIWWERISIPNTLTLSHLLSFPSRMYNWWIILKWTCMAIGLNVSCM